MTWVVALTTGAGVGLTYFGGLWLTLTITRGRALLTASYFARLALVGLVFAGLSLEGASHVIAGLVGLLLARRWLVARIGGVGHGQ